jgi:hypothetical protein
VVGEEARLPWDIWGHDSVGRSTATLLRKAERAMKVDGRSIVITKTVSLDPGRIGATCAIEVNQLDR